MNRTWWHYRTAHKKHTFLVKTKEKSKSQKQIPKKKVSLEILHQILGHRFTRTLWTGGNANVWQDIELRVYPEPLCTSCQISTTTKGSWSKIPLKPNTHFKWVCMNIIPATSCKSVTKYTNYVHDLLFEDSYSKIEKLYGMENITTEEVMDKL